jgi:DNA adenine methylase
MDPLLKWAGGKRWLVPQLVPEIVKAKPKRYIEPFLGAGAIALALPEHCLHGALLNDFSSPLVNFWRIIQKYPKVFAEATGKAFDEFKNEKEGYYCARDEFNRNPNATGVRQAALMFYLNKTCFNGLWRTNQKGEMNVPFGDNRSPSKCSEKNAVAFAEKISKVIFSCGPFESVMDHAGTGDLVFNDPPYHEGFVAYTEDGFSEDQQRLLAQKSREAVERGATVFSTNSDTPLIREIYAWALVEEISETRLVAAKAENRKSAPCLFITGLPKPA